MNHVQETVCISCSADLSLKSKSLHRWYSTFPGFLLFLLPKCPFCVVAYSSSMAICGAPSIVSHHTDWGAWLALGLATVCIGSIARNYRGKGTRTALFIALLGLSLLLFGLFTPNAMSWYYTGAILLVFSSFYNGRGYQWLSRVL